MKIIVEVTLIRHLKISLHINVHLIDRYFEAQEESLTINYQKENPLTKEDEKGISASSQCYTF